MNEEIIIKIAGAMRIKNINQNELSKLTGISRPTLSKIIKSGNGKKAQLITIFNELGLEWGEK